MIRGQTCNKCKKAYNLGRLEATDLVLDIFPTHFCCPCIIRTIFTQMLSKLDLKIQICFYHDNVTDCRARIKLALQFSYGTIHWHCVLFICRTRIPLHTVTEDEYGTPTKLALYKWDHFDRAKLTLNILLLPELNDYVWWRLRSF